MEVELEGKVDPASIADAVAHAAAAAVEPAEVIRVA